MNEKLNDAMENASNSATELLDATADTVKDAFDEVADDAREALEGAEQEAHELMDNASEAVEKTVEDAKNAKTGNSFLDNAMKWLGNSAQGFMKASDEKNNADEFKISEQAFIKDTVLTLSPENFQKLRDAIANNLIKFWFIPTEDITREILAEKLYDHFFKTYTVTGQFFEKQIYHYITSVSAMVDHYIEPEPKADAEGNTEEPCRARQFFNKAQEIKSNRNVTANDVLEFSRLMFCLYEGTLRDRLNKITDFEYSVDLIEPTRILDSMKKETNEKFFGIKNKVFNLEGLYDLDKSAMIIATICLYKIAEDRTNA